MFAVKGAVTLAIGLMAVSGVLAQDLGPLGDLKACRLESGDVALSFTYEGSPCWGTLDPLVEPGETEDRADITIPTEATADMCTMNIVTNEVATTFAAEAAVTSLDVVLLNTEGGGYAGGTVDVAPAGPDCVAPEEPAAE